MKKNSKIDNRALKILKMKMWSNFNFRLLCVLVFIIIGFMRIIIHLFYLQIVKGEEYKALGENQYRSKYEIKSKRGRIISNDGEILAYDGEDYGIILDPTLIKDENVDKLMDLFKKNLPSLDTDKIKQSIAEKKR